MYDAATFAPLFSRTYRVIHMQTEGLTHADSVLQPPFRGNCLNWVLGHIIVSRNQILDRLASSSLGWDKEDLARYERQSEPITQAEQALPLGRLLTTLDRSQELLLASFETTTPATWETLVEDESLADWVAFLHWHETYHVGQLELLRQLAGTNDKII
jgi:uncharacterized damage-inducible protein DinB